MFYFVDKCLPFGASRSCAIFQAFSNALAHILTCWVNQRNCLTNYLDDFLFLALTKLWCDHLVNQFLKLCDMVGCPVADDKTEWGDSVMVFLGILLDGIRWVLAVPEDKRCKAVQLIQWTLSRRTVTVKHLQKLTGSLNFLCRAIVPGRTFLRRLYDHMKTSDGTELKQYHHVRVNKQIRDDCQMWLTFLTGDQQALCRPFVDLKVFDTSETLDFYTDSSACETLGFGCIFRSRWMFGQWEPGFIRECNPSIAYLELAALVMAVLTWGKLLRNKRIIIYCDNQSVVQMVNNTTSRCTNCMVLIRKLVLDGMFNNRRVFVRYVASRDNGRVDSLSRLKLNRFRKLAPQANELPDYPTPEVWPLSHIWLK